MEITIKENVFKPVIITLESEAEVELLDAMVHFCNNNSMDFLRNIEKCGSIIKYYRTSNEDLKFIQKIISKFQDFFSPYPPFRGI